MNWQTFAGRTSEASEQTITNFETNEEIALCRSNWISLMMRQLILQRLALDQIKRVERKEVLSMADLQV